MSEDRRSETSSGGWVGLLRIERADSSTSFREHVRRSSLVESVVRPRRSPEPDVATGNRGMGGDRAGLTAPTATDEERSRRSRRPPNRLCLDGTEARWRTIGGRRCRGLGTATRGPNRLRFRSTSLGVSLAEGQRLDALPGRRRRVLPNQACRTPQAVPPGKLALGTWPICAVDSGVPGRPPRRL